MRSIWYSLAWKEFHEHKWKLVAILGALCGVTSLVILLENSNDRYGLAVGMLFLCSVPLAVFLGLGAAANENSRRTFAFLQSQPVPLWQLAIVKLVAGMLTIATAVVLALLTFPLWQEILTGLGVSYSEFRPAEFPGPIRTGNRLADLAIECLLPAISLYIWTAAAGVNRKDEIRAAIVALVVIIGWSYAMASLSARTEFSGSSMAWLRVILLGAAPGAVFANFELHQHPSLLPLFIVVYIATHTLLCVFYALRFGAIKDGAAQNASTASTANRQADWLGSPRRSAVDAIAWKQLRESGPIAIIGLLGTFAICMLAVTMNSFQADFARTYGEVAMTLGFGIALVVGIGVALHDSEPGINSFWRTRPINPNTWFAIKFFTGLAIIVVTIQVPFLLITRPDASHVTEFESRQVFETQFTVVALQAAVFAAAVAMTCLVRHAIYAAVLSLGLPIATVSALALSCYAAAQFGWVDAKWNSLSAYENPTIVLGGAVLCFAISTVTAWLAVRNDWGWKSRY
jgi:hypothetical protein